VPAEAFCEKIQAAANAKSSRDFLLVARTDARGVTGIDDAIRRANRYVEAGADAVFPEGLRTAEEFAQVAREVPAHLLANMTEFGTTPYLTVDEFSRMGYRMVVFPVTLQRAAMRAMQDVLAAIQRDGTQRSVLERMQSRQELYDLLEYGGKVDKPAGP
jgi:methylisocitrate lyase